MVYSSESTNLVDEFATIFQNAGYTEQAQALINSKKGGFGSGFVYVDTDGTNYIITNRHVVELCKTCDVVFKDRKGNETKYENLTIFAESQDFDIAILKFPEGVAPFKKGLTISSGELFDGDEVYSAGYPALAGKPSWQFAHGYVTNDYLLEDDLMSSEISALIQHSAPIDSGSSGGPLLVKNPKVTGGYEVRGINTWKAYGRASVGLSIPGKAVMDFIESSMKNKTKTQEEINDQVKVAAENLIELLQKNDTKYSAILPYVSMEITGYFGVKFFERICRNFSTEDIEHIANVFVDDGPINSMRYAFSFVLYHEFQEAFKACPYDAKFVVSDVKYVENGNEKYWNVVVQNKNEAGDVFFTDTFKFIYEAQGARIFTTTGLYNYKETGKFNTVDSKAISKYYRGNKNAKQSDTIKDGGFAGRKSSLASPMTFEVQVNFASSFKKSEKYSSDLDFLTFGPEGKFYLNGVKTSFPYSIGFFGDLTEVDTDIFAVTGATLGTWYPINLENINFMIYGEIGAGYAIGEIPSPIIVEEAGAKVIFNPIVFYHAITIAEKVYYIPATNTAKIGLKVGLSVGL